MGQYYYFVHQNGQPNTKPLPFNFNVSWTKNFENLSDHEQVKIFQHVSNLNDWPSGKIYAQGDYGRMFVYIPESNQVKEVWNLSDEETSDEER